MKETGVRGESSEEPGLRLGVQPFRQGRELVITTIAVLPPDSGTQNPPALGEEPNGCMDLSSE